MFNLSLLSPSNFPLAKTTALNASFISHIAISFLSTFASFKSLKNEIKKIIQKIRFLTFGIAKAGAILKSTGLVAASAKAN